MFQFYYAEKSGSGKFSGWEKSLAQEVAVSAVRPAMWEEHCLECSAPACYKSCPHFLARQDRRCRRFYNSLETFEDARACCGQGVHVKFRPWANMMTVIFPGMLNVDEYLELWKRNQTLGNFLHRVLVAPLPVWIRWNFIRAVEYIRRRWLKHLPADGRQPDFFVFHGYSHSPDEFRLIVEIYDDHTPVYRFSLPIRKGENFHLVDKSRLTPLCSKAGYLVKVYPENDLEAELDVLWCDFICGRPVVRDVPAAKVKCVVWDLDNTLWDGTLIETECKEELKLRPGIAETVRALDARGIIQSVASKNTFSEAMEVLTALGMADYFLCPQIHWGEKSSSLQTIASDLNIGLDTLAFIDDSAFEREAVRTLLPQVRIFTEKEIPSLLSRDEFDVPITDESPTRRMMYQAEADRRKMRNDRQLDLASFIRQCHLSMEVFTPRTDREMERCFELVARTNQLNMSGIKYDRAEFSDVIRRPGHRNIAFSCRDDFGDYGVVCYCQYTLTDAELVVTEFALSCRVAGKFVESAFFACLLENTQKNVGKFRVQKTVKNVLLRETLTKIGFELCRDDEIWADYSFRGNLAGKDLVSVRMREEGIFSHK